MCAQWVARGPGFHHGDSEDSDQTGQTPSHFVGFVMSRLTCNSISWAVVGKTTVLILALENEFLELTMNLERGKIISHQYLALDLS